MLHRGTEKVVLIVLILILPFIVTPIMNIVFEDILPTNAHISIEEFLELTVPTDNSFDYIQEGDYLNILIYDEAERVSQNICAYKGKTSGYITQAYGRLNRNNSKTRLKRIDNDGVHIAANLVKHKNSYLFDISSFETDLVLTDNEGNKIESMVLGHHIEFFEVLDLIPDDYEIYGNIDGKRFLVLDYQMIKDILG